MIRIFFTTIFLLFIISGISGQENTVSFEIDSSIVKLINKHQQINSRELQLKGFRVQLVSLSGNNARKDAQAIRAKFMAQYPDVPSYLIPQLPNFKVRVGDFRDRFEAYRFYKEVKPHYPSAYIINDQISYPALDPWEPAPK